MSAFCTFCGAPAARIGTRFCTVCGRPLARPETSPVDAPSTIDEDDSLSMRDFAREVAASLGPELPVDPRKEIGSRRWAERGAYCDLDAGDLLSGFVHVDSGRAAALFTRFVTTHRLSVASQGNGIVAGGWALGETNRRVALWFRPGTLHGESTVLAGSTIAAIRPGHPQLASQGSQARRTFADLVICPSEQSGATAMISRWMSSWSGDPAPLLDPQPEECTFGEAPVDDLPRRALLCEPADGLGSLILFTHPDRGPESVPLPAGSWSVVLVYAVPAYESYEAFDDTLATAVDSMLRIHELLWNTSSGLDGRRDPAQAPVLGRYLDTTGVIGVLDVVDQPWRLTAGPSRR